MLLIRDFSKSYAKSTTLAVDGLNLELRPGEIFGFLGPNGAGKTTTIKAITGILPFERGQISICGFDIQHQATQAKRNIGYVSDSHVIYDKLTGREYVSFLADVYGVTLADRVQRATRLLELFELSDAYDSAIRTYSHGMKQKISIIGALIHNPKFWMLDEPMTGLDPQSSFQLKTLMRTHCEQGNTVFFSTHILEVAEKLCDRVGIIVKGRLVAAGTVSELRSARADKSLEDIFLALASEGGDGQ